MKFFKTAYGLLVLSFFFQVTQVVASNIPELEEMVVYGRFKDTDPETDCEDTIEGIGRILISKDNREIFQNIPATGEVVKLTNENKALYEQIIYAQPGLQLTLGKTFVLVPKYKGETYNDPIRRMNFPSNLSFLNR